jgi:hypothetical protein
MSEAWPEPKGGYKPISRIGTPLTDKDILAMGYEPTDNGWKPFRHDLLPDKENTPEQSQLLENYKLDVTEVAAPAKPPARQARSSRKGRTARKR